MVDVFTMEKRSDIMSRVHSHNNKSTELKMITVFREMSIRGWRRNYKVIGHPDFVFFNDKIAVFVDGCFWHGHDCRNTRPTSNKEYWEKKRLRNIEHDKLVTLRFEKRGWRVIRIWECELKKNNREVLEEKLAPLFYNKR